MLKSLFRRRKKRAAASQVPSLRELIRRETNAGLGVFGPVPAGRARQFYCLDKNTWVWYEAWVDNRGSRQAVTTHYEVRGNAVLKIQGTRNPEKLAGDELNNLAAAVKSYYQTIANEVYHRSKG